MLKFQGVPHAGEAAQVQAKVGVGRPLLQHQHAADEPAAGQVPAGGGQDAARPGGGVDAAGEGGARAGVGAEEGAEQAGAAGAAVRQVRQEGQVARGLAERDGEYSEQLAGGGHVAVGRHVSQAGGDRHGHAGAG